MLRAVFILVLVIGLSLAATVYFGRDVVIALGLILVQIKLLAKKLMMTDWPAVLVWLKTQSQLFLRVELIKKYLTTTVMPLVMGRALLRRIKAGLRVYLDAVAARQAAMMAWFRGLTGVERGLAWAVLVLGTLALTVSTLGLWLILFSVQLPLWLVAGAAAMGKMLWTSLSKSLFKMLAFLQLRWLWRGLRRLLPRRWLEAKRRWDYRVARAVVRRRRMTVRQLAARKDTLPFRMGVMLEYLLGGR